MSKEQTDLLTARIKKEMEAIIFDAMERLSQEEEKIKELPEITKKRLVGLFDGYLELEKTMKEFSTLSILGVTGKTAKTMEWPPYYYVRSGLQEETLTIGVNGYDTFYQHPTGREFKLNGKKKYRLLVAFIEEK